MLCGFFSGMHIVQHLYLLYLTRICDLWSYLSYRIYLSIFYLIPIYLILHEKIYLIYILQGWKV